MTPKYPVKEFMERTKVNLEHIKSADTSHGKVFYVTQLINSFSCALAHPWELVKPGLKNVRFVDEAGSTWPQIRPNGEAFETPRTVGRQLTLIRNCFAHGNLQPLDAPGEPITQLEIWNSDGRYTTWSATVTVEQLEDLLEKFVEVAAELLGDLQREVPPPLTRRLDSENVHCRLCNQFVPYTAQTLYFASLEGGYQSSRSDRSGAPCQSANNSDG